MYDYLWYAPIALLIAFAFVALLVFNIRYERARRKAEAKMTSEERKEKAVRSNAAGKGWGLPL